MTVSRETVPRQNLESRLEHVSRETISANVSRETLERLDTFASLLKRWNQRINLISRHDEGMLWTRHILDSWKLATLLPTSAAVAADFGSGAGFPGLVVSIVSNLPMHLVEVDHRKAAFLREAARISEARATIHVCRVENAVFPRVDVVMARGLAQLPSLLALAVLHLAPKGVCLFPKGENVDREIADAQEAWIMRVERHISSADRRGVILRISEVTRV